MNKKHDFKTVVQRIHVTEDAPFYTFRAPVLLGKLMKKKVTLQFGLLSVADLWRECLLNYIIHYDKQP